MKTSRTLILMSKYSILLLAGIFLSNCNAYYSTFPEDGIYTRKVVEIHHDNGPNRYRSSKSSYYKNYFNNLAEQGNYVTEDDVITDTENYSSYQDPEGSHSSYQSYGPFGSSPNTTNIYIQSYPYFSGFSHWGYPRNRGLFRRHRPFFGPHYPSYFHNPHYISPFYSPYYSYFPYFNHWHGHHYSPYFGHGYGYNSWRPNRRWWRNYSWDDWSSGNYFRPRHSRGYNSVSFSNSRRGESKSNSKERRIRVREPKSSVKRNSLPSSIVLSRLQAGRSTSNYYDSNEAIKSYRNSNGNSNVNEKNYSRGRNSSNISATKSSSQKRIKTNTPSYSVKSRSVGRNSTLTRRSTNSTPNSTISKNNSKLSSVRNSSKPNYTASRKARSSYSTGRSSSSQNKKVNSTRYQQRRSTYGSSYGTSSSTKSSTSSSYRPRSSNTRSSYQKSSSSSRSQSSYQPRNNVQRSSSGRSSSSSLSRSSNQSSSSSRTSSGRSSSRRN